MRSVTRRGFIKQGAATGAATVGGLAVGPGVAAALAGAAGITAAELAGHAGGVPLVAYISDASRGELALVAGEREVTVHNPDLVLRLLKAAK